VPHVPPFRPESSLFRGRRSTAQQAPGTRARAVFWTSGGAAACKSGVCMRCCAPGSPCRAAARMPGCGSVRRPCRHGAACVSFPPYRAPSLQQNAQSCTQAGQHGVAPVRDVCGAVSAVPDTVLCDVHLCTVLCGLRHASAMSNHCE